MLDISAGPIRAPGKVLAIAVQVADDEPRLVPLADPLADDLLAETTTLLAEVEHPGRAGTVTTLPRPGRTPGNVVLVGVGRGDEAGWRTAGAALVRAAARHTTVSVRPPDAEAAGALAEGAWLSAYRFRLGAPPDRPPLLRRISIQVTDITAAEAALRRTRALVDAVSLARDLTNTPSLQKSPKWLADRIAAAAARRTGVVATVHGEDFLTQQGFGGVLAVGAGSARPPRLVELAYRPRGARTHVVLVGKGITFDSGGISIKTGENMRLMRKDMGGAAAVCAAVLAAADLRLPVRVTALAPLAENMISGSATRPGDVIRHYGGLTTEVLNTDAEGRLVLGDALAYAARRLKPDLVVDLATLTGAQNVALGKRIAALFTHDDDLAGALSAAGEEVDERMWRLPLPDDYAPMVASGIADLSNSPLAGGAGAVAAALFLREFTGTTRDRWAHIDMSAPAWSDKNDGPLVKGATGWGVRLLVRWLATL